MSYMGLDIGVTGTKAVVFSIEGKILSRSYYDYGINYKKNLTHKGMIDPIHILQGVKKVIRDCNTLCLADRPKTIAVSVSGDDVFPADRNGKPLFNVIAAFDQRGFEYRKSVAEKIGFDKIFDITGQRVDTDTPALIRILWMKNNVSGLFKKIWKFLCWESYVNYYLTGNAVTDCSNASRFATFDIINSCWSKKILDTFDIPQNTMPEARLSGTKVGQIKKDVAEELNLPKDLMVVTGGMDQNTASLGAGVIDEGIFSLGMGTVMASHWLIKDFEKITTNEYVYCSSLMKDSFFGLLVNFNGSNIVNWFFENIASSERNLHKDGVYDYFNSSLNSYPSKLFFMPHFTGGQHPYDDPRSKGLLLGLNFKTEKKEILKSIYEGIAFDLKLNYDNLLAKTGFKISQIRAVGGGSRSEVWVKILANILNTEFLLPGIDEGGCLTCAMLGAVAVEDFKNIKESVSNFIKTKKIIPPEDKAVDLFIEKFEVYKKIYPNIKECSYYLD